MRVLRACARRRAARTASAPPVKVYVVRRTYHAPENIYTAMKFAVCPRRTIDARVINRTLVRPPCRFIVFLHILVDNQKIFLTISIRINWKTKKTLFCSFVNTKNNDVLWDSADKWRFDKTKEKNWCSGWNREIRWRWRTIIDHNYSFSEIIDNKNNWNFQYIRRRIVCSVIGHNHTDFCVLAEMFRIQ